MPSYQIRQSTTAYPLVFLMVQSSDHVTALTGASPTVTLSKAGGAFASPSGAVSEISAGWYKVAGNATDTGTLGSLVLHATAASGDPTDTLYEVVAHDVQDSVRLGLSALPNAAANASGGLPVNNSGLAVKADVDTIKTQAVTCAAGVTVPTSIASPTNITAATGIVLSGVTHTGAVIPTVTTTTTATNLTNAPTAGDLTATMKTSVTTAASSATPVATVSGDLTSTMKTSVTTACTAATPTAAAVTGAVGSVTGAVGSVTGNVGGNVVGSVGSLTLTQAIPTSNTAQTLGDCLNAARVQGFGKWVISGTTLSLYASDGTTVVRSFTLDSSSAPTSRT